ncbi:MAG: Bcr/CflA family efflux MFS transporter [Betaproteobacteria bacterium]|nr:MAG: Bcr/CflA family efflux MFS transporter [Betaproteobacteria bacterium]
MANSAPEFGSGRTAQQQALVDRYAGGRERMKLTYLLAALSMLGPFSIDTYLPAFSEMQAALPATEVQMQLTLTLYFIGFAVVSLFHGAISDSIGRKPVIMGTICVHGVASIGCALSGSIESLLAFRLLQGMFAGAGFVVGRAVVRDLFDGDEAQRQLSRIQMLFALAPIIAPILGGWLVAHLNWPSIFWFLFGYAAVLVIWTRVGLVESHLPSARLPFAVVPLIKTYRGIFFNKTFQLLASIPGINFMGFFVYIAGAPAFVMRHLELTSTDFAVLFIPSIAGITLGAYLSGRLAGRITYRRQMNSGFAIMTVAAGINIAVSALISPSVVWHIAPIALYTFGMSLVSPPITIKLLDAFSYARGSVSALQSSCHVAMMAVTTAIVVPFAQQSLLRFALVMAGSVLLGWIIWLGYQRAHRFEEK